MKGAISIPQFTSNWARAGTKRRGRLPTYRVIRQPRFYKRVNDFITRRPLSPEAGTVDYVATPAISSTMFIDWFNAIAQGDDIFHRRGRRVQMKSLALHINFHPSLTPLDDYIRVAVVYDKGSNGGLPTWADVFTDVDESGAVTADALSQPNASNYARFTIIRNWRFNLRQPTGAGQGLFLQTGTQTTDNNNNNIDCFIPLNGLIAHYELGSITNAPSTGALYIMIKTINTANYGCTIRGRLRFYSSM